MKIAITGHRPNKLDGDYELDIHKLSPLMQKIRSEIELIICNEQPDILITGMALGIDQLFAKIALFMDIPFIAAIPFIGYNSKWPSERIFALDKLLQKSKDIEIICEPGYAAWKMQKRNEWMVDNCDLLIAVWDGTSGGTANCVKYAESVNKKIIIINPKELEYE